MSLLYAVIYFYRFFYLIFFTKNSNSFHIMTRFSFKECKKHQKSYLLVKFLLMTNISKEIVVLIVKLPPWQSPMLTSSLLIIILKLHDIFVVPLDWMHPFSCQREEAAGDQLRVRSRGC